jgi:pimeloyl-ACP methyl ester carboxylesterase
MPKITANGLTTYYHQAGQGPDVVMIHGLTGNLSIWYLYAMPALAAEFRVTAYDLRGHGYSELTPGGYTSAHFAADLDGLLQTLGIERAHLVGYSYGATVAMHCALLYPSRVASLVLAEPWISALRPLVDLDRWAARDAARARFAARGMNVPEDKWFDLDYVLREAVRAHEERGETEKRPEPGRFRAPGPGADPGEMWSSLTQHWFPPGRRLRRLMDETPALKEALEVGGLTLERMTEIRQPTLAIYGELSPFLQAAHYLEESMPNCRLTVLQRAAHYFALAEPETLVETVRKFLREVGPDGVSPGGTVRE